MIRKIVAVLSLAGFAASAWTQSASITQIDSSSLLTTQRNRLYARLLDSKGEAVENPDPASISVFESIDGASFEQVQGTTVKAGSNKTQGISFLFLIDNSGSMYETPESTAAVDERDTRSYIAKRAVETFLLSITGSQDTVGLASFNTRYKLLTDPARDRRKVAAALDGISKPAREEGYTELYASIIEASGGMREVRGRKALVVLSDGINYPYAKYEKADHPEYGNKIFTSDEALDEALRDGITIFAVNFGVETVCLRYFNVFGPRQALDDEYAVVIPKFIHCILNDQQPPIFGTGKQSRDFTYIDNVVQANILAATRPGIRHAVFNVANGKDTTVLRIVGLLDKILGKDIKPQFLPVRAGDVFRTLADITKIRRQLGYRPVVGFEEGLRRTVEWFKEKEARKA